MSTYENKLLTLSDGYQYIVLDNTEYNWTNYAVVNEVVNGKLGSNITLYRIVETDRVPLFVLETNLDIIETVLSKMV